MHCLCQLCRFQFRWHCHRSALRTLRLRIRPSSLDWEDDLYCHRHQTASGHRPTRLISAITATIRYQFYGCERSLQLSLHSWPIRYCRRSPDGTWEDFEPAVGVRAIAVVAGSWPTASSCWVRWSWRARYYCGRPTSVYCRYSRFQSYCLRLIISCKKTKTRKKETKELAYDLRQWKTTTPGDNDSSHDVETARAAFPFRFHSLLLIGALERLELSGPIGEDSVTSWPPLLVLPPPGLLANFCAPANWWGLARRLLKDLSILLLSDPITGSDAPLSLCNSK